MVYFVYAHGINRIKIGYCQENNLDKRLGGIKVSCPVKLTIIGIIPEVSKVVELFLHRKFSAYRKCGEWFQVTPEIRNFLIKLQKEEYQTEELIIPKLKVLTKEENLKIKKKSNKKFNFTDSFLVDFFKDSDRLKPVGRRYEFNTEFYDDENFSPDLLNVLKGNSQFEN